MLLILLGLIAVSLLFQTGRHGHTVFRGGAVDPEIGDAGDVKTTPPPNAKNVLADTSDPYKNVRLWRIIDFFRTFWLTR